MFMESKGATWDAYSDEHCVKIVTSNGYDPLDMGIGNEELVKSDVLCSVGAWSRCCGHGDYAGRLLRPASECATEGQGHANPTGAAKQCGCGR